MVSNKKMQGQILGQMKGLQGQMQGQMQGLQGLQGLQGQMKGQMKDQMKDQMLQLLNNIDSPEKLLYGVIIILLITYSSLIPSEYRTFADSILGKVLGLSVIYGVTQTMGMIYGLLTAIAFLLMLQGASRLYEGFNGTKKETVGDRWFVEKILGEYPVSIESDHKETYPIQ